MSEFDHHFEPPNATSLGDTCVLSVREIEDAGVREVLEAPGAALGSWSILNALLSPGADFILREPLGRSREVKTALSGLFGRFVARAYAERHLGMTHFQHLYSVPFTLNGATGAQVRRITAGDLPDWVAWSAGGQFAIIEAKGCHSRASATLDRAYQQAERVDIQISGRLAPFKRYAIVSRWRHATTKMLRSQIFVRDPDVDAEPLDDAQYGALATGIALHQYAALLRPLGHGELADTLSHLTTTPFPNLRDKDQARALSLLNQASRVEARTSVRREPADALIGGTVVRGGPLADAGRLSAVDRETLARLDLRPTFVGVERRALEAAIRGDHKALERERIEEALSDPDDRLVGPSTNGGGAWVIRIQEDDVEFL